MKINNNSEQFLASETINKIFKKNGKKEIPDVEEICSKARINRKTALKYLYKWWEQYQGSELKMPEINLHFAGESAEDNGLEHAIISLQCLAKELDIHNDSLNHQANHSFPLSNIIINSLQEIENKLFASHTHMNRLKNDKKMTEKQLAYVMQENGRLDKEINEMQTLFTEKQEQLQEQLDAKKREVLAANQLIKSLKREKQIKPKKVFFYDYNLIMNQIRK